MEIGKAIYNILSTTTNISDLVGTRIFPNVAPQTTTFPFIIYDVTGVQPNDTKDGASTLDTNDVMISCYSETYSQASDLAQKIRVAMDRINEGTYGGEQIQSSQFQSYNDIFDDTSGDAGIYRKALDFEIRQINPTGITFTNVYSLAFDGVDDVLVTQADTTASSSTYSFWCKSSTTGQNRGVFGHGTDKQGAFHFNFAVSFRPLLYLGTNYFRFWNDASAQDDGQWHHWVVYSDTNDITNSKLYVDGVLQTVNTTSTTGSLEAYTEGLNIGGDKVSSGNYFEGNIDEFAWFSTELTQSQITTIYNNGVPTDLSSMSGLSGYWRMGDPNGQSSYPTITDDSSNSNNGTMIAMSSANIETNVPS